MTIRNTVGASALGISLVLAAAGCAPTSTTATAGGGQTEVAVTDETPTFTSAKELAESFDTSTLCGDKPIKIGWAMGVGVTWNLTVDAMVRKEAEKCPNVTIQTTDAQADPQKSISDVNSLVAQGIDGIFTNPLFGEAQLPSLRAAVNAGVPVVTFISTGGAKIGTDITDTVSLDQPTNGTLWAEFLDRAIGKGTVVFLGGEPGQPSSVANMNAIREAFKKYPDLKLVENEMQPARNSAAEMKRVMAGLLAQHGRIDAVITDNGTVTATVLDAYKDAGFELPALAVSAASNGLTCTWKKDNFKFFSTDGNHAPAIIAFRKLLAEINGIEDNESNVIKPWAVIDTEKGMDPKCDESASPDADWSTTLSDDEMRSLFKK